jgi:tetratricopeptide (TPR) repeat protein
VLWQSSVGWSLIALGIAANVIGGRLRGGIRRPLDPNAGGVLPSGSSDPRSLWQARAAVVIGVVLILTGVICLSWGGPGASQSVEAYNRGVVKSQKGDVEGAIADYTTAIELNPRFVEAYNNRAGARYEKGEVDAAIVDYTKAIDLDSNCESAWFGRGFARGSMGDWDGAIADYSEAIDLKPTFNACFARGLILLYQFKDVEAQQDFDQCLVLEPNREAELEEAMRLTKEDRVK